MRRVHLGAPPQGAVAKIQGDDLMRWIMKSLTEIEVASHIEVESVCDVFVLPDGFSTLYTFDPDTVTTGELARAFATFIADVRKRGTKRTVPT